MKGRGTAGVVSLAVALAVASCELSLPSASPRYETAAEACKALVGDDWQVAVEVDHPDASALALVLGRSIATCLTGHSDGGFGSTTSVGVGGGLVRSPAVLSYVTGQKAADENALVGQVPPGAQGVRLTFANGSIQAGTVGNGFWLAWTPSSADPTAILDAAGATIAEISDPNGIQPSTSDGPSPS
jgi:hypothetical protein